MNLTKIQELYEDIQLNKSGPPKSQMMREAERRVEDATSVIEYCLQGVINYYNQTRQKINISAEGVDMNPIKDLEDLAQRIQPILAQYGEFTDEKFSDD